MRERLFNAGGGWLEYRTSREALSAHVASTGKAGALVMSSGVAGSCTRRKLDPRELRGFALADPLAPMVLVNGQDPRSARTFTLAHELAHFRLGTSALLNLPSPSVAGIRKEEVWCHVVAVEFLAPVADIEREIRADEALEEAKMWLSRHFNVSTLVAPPRLLDLDWINRERFDASLSREVAGSESAPRSGGGGF